MDKEPTFEEFERLHDELFGDQGPSISSSSGNYKKHLKDCGCWKCDTIRFRRWIKDGRIS
ncbi:MAG: hypothetical protein AM326_09835 [Candidatus Thorarchaeota archaeon SMTZ-45]|nr:MAG: hypothetical protein AM326_09835 [Candidatus Thorarchaeota archaeon SMTZ-45]